MDDRAAALAGIRLFEGLGELALEQLSRISHESNFKLGEFVFREGEAGDAMYLIRQGKVTKEISPPQSEPLIVQTLEEGDILGWSWLVPPYQWRYDARALTMTRAIALDGACLRNKCEHDRELGYELLKRFSLTW